jgi:GT2 family glycosyltransferase
MSRAVAALSGQEDPGVPWELVVVDNDDAPGVERAFDAVASPLGGRARLVREPHRGAAAARNAGIAAAHGDVIAFCDDDVVPAHDWLRRLVEPVLSGRSDGAGGRVQLDPTAVLPRWLGRDWRGYLSEFDLGDDERELGPDDYVLSASAVFATELLRRVGGFDPVLGPRPNVPMVNDDIDLCRRFMRSGGRIHYVPDAVVVHEVPADRLTPRYLLRRTYAQGRSDWLLDRDVNARRPLGGAQGILGHMGRLLADRTGEGLWHPDVAMGALLSVSQTAGFLREAAAAKLQRGSAR